METPDENTNAPAPATARRRRAPAPAAAAPAEATTPKPKAKRAPVARAAALKPPTVLDFRLRNSIVLEQVHKEMDTIETEVAQRQIRYAELQALAAGIHAADIAMDPTAPEAEAAMVSLRENLDPPDFTLGSVSKSAPVTAATQQLTEQFNNDGLQAQLDRQRSEQSQ